MSIFLIPSLSHFMEIDTSTPLQFLNPGPTFTDPARSKVVILPLPLEKTTSYMKGTSRGPAAIIEASTQVELYDPEMGLEPCSIGIHTDWDLGDPASNELPMETLLDRIRAKTRKLLAADKFVLALGGEHTITVGLIDPYIEKFGKNFTVVQLDAHADLKDQYQDSLYSHACVMRRILGRVPIVSAGIRSIDPEEVAAAKSPGIRLFYAHEIRKNPKWMDDLVAAIQTKDVYLTIDVDGFDPSVVPSVGTPEPGGLYWEETLELLRAIRAKHRIIGADVNELCPGPARYADFTVAKLVHKIVAYSLFDPPPR